MLQYNKNLKQFKKDLRNNMPDAERILWNKIKKDQLGVRFNRQRIIGNYIVDFYCDEIKLAIELDGRQHYSEEAIEKDKIRDEYLKNLGLKIVRFRNSSIYKNLHGVANIIYNIVQESLKEIKPKENCFYKGDYED